MTLPQTACPSCGGPVVSGAVKCSGCGVLLVGVDLVGADAPTPAPEKRAAKAKAKAARTVTPRERWRRELRMLAMLSLQISLFGILGGTFLWFDSTPGPASHVDPAVRRLFVITVIPLASVLWFASTAGCAMGRPWGAHGVVLASAASVALTPWWRVLVVLFGDPPEGPPGKGLIDFMEAASYAWGSYPALPFLLLALFWARHLLRRAEALKIAAS